MPALWASQGHISILGELISQLCEQLAAPRGLSLVSGYIPALASLYSSGYVAFARLMKLSGALKAQACS